MHSSSFGGDYVTVDSLADGGKDTVLSRAVCGKRALLFVRLGSGAFGVVTAALDRDCAVDRVLGVVRVSADELAGLDAALVHARRAYSEGVKR